MAEKEFPTGRSRGNIDDVIQKLDKLNESTMRVQAAVEAPASMKERFLDAVPSTISETKNTDRSLKQEKDFDKEQGKQAQKKSIEDRVQTEMDIRETNENRNEIASESKKVLKNIATMDGDMNRAISEEEIRQANEGVTVLKKELTDESIKQRNDLQKNNKTFTDVQTLLKKNAKESAEQREVTLEKQLEAGVLTDEQVKILKMIRDGDVEAAEQDKVEAGVILKKYDDEQKKLTISQRIAKDAAQRIDDLAKAQYYSTKLQELEKVENQKIAEAQAAGDDARVQELSKNLKAERDVLLSKKDEETPQDKETRQENQKVFTKISGGIEKLGGNFSEFIGNMGQKAKGGAFMALKAFGAGALLVGLIKFLESDYFDSFLEGVKGFMGFLDGVAEFLGPGGALVVALGTIFAILNPIKSISFLITAGKLLAGLFSKKGGLMKGITNLTSSLGGTAGKIFGFAKNTVGKFTGLFSKGGGVSKGISSLTSSMSGKFGFAKTAAGKFTGLFSKGGGITKGLSTLTSTIGKTFPAGGKLTSGLMSGLGKFTGIFAKGGGLLSGLGGIAGSVMKFAGPVGLAVTAAKGLYDGATAGIEEYKKSGDMGAAVREGLAGAASGLTFGLVSQETISGGLTAIGNAAGSIVDGFTGLFKSDSEKEKDRIMEDVKRIQDEGKKHHDRSVSMQQMFDEKARLQSDGEHTTHISYLNSLLKQKEVRLNEIAKQEKESGDASKGFLGTIGQGMKNYYGNLGGGILSLFKSSEEKEADRLRERQSYIDKEIKNYENASQVEREALDEIAQIESDGKHKTHLAYMASLQVQTEDQLAQIERQKAESGDASKSFLGSLGEGMKNYYSFLGGLVPDGVKDIGKSVLSFGKNLFGMDDDEEKEKVTEKPNIQRQAITGELKMLEELSDTSTKLQETTLSGRARIQNAKGSLKQGNEARLGVKETFDTLAAMMKSDIPDHRIIAESVVEQLDKVDRVPGDGRLQAPRGRGYKLKVFATQMYDIIDTIQKEDVIAVTDAKEVLRDFDLGQKIADMETSQAEGEDKAGNIRAILQDNVVSEVEEKQLREAGVEDRFFSGAESEARDEIAKLTAENAKRAEEIAMLKAERESRNELGNMLMAPTSNVVNNQSKTIVPSPIMNPSPPAGTAGYSRSSSYDDF